MKAYKALTLISSIVLAALALADSFLKPIPVRMRKPIRCGSIFDQTARSTIPSRYDSCKLLISGVVGTEPKEIYLKSGHYVVNFALAVVGHYKAIHQQESYKPAETMWLSVEIWDKLAKKSYSNIKKGRPVRGIGYIVQNKWTEKNTGEERKMYKVRITKMLSSEEFDSVHELLEDSDGTRELDCFPTSSDSGFSSEAPDVEDQTNGARSCNGAIQETVVQSSGYSYRKRSSPAARREFVQHIDLTSQHFSPQEPPPDLLQAVHTPPSSLPGASQSGQHVWESLKTSYPGMIKPRQITGPEWG